MGIFTSHLCEEPQTQSPSSEVPFLGIPRESQDLCCSQSYCLWITEIHPKDCGNPPNLLLSFISPHKAISKQSVSRWLSRALCMAGFELNSTGHSIRGASSSAAAAAGLSGDLILEAADWAFVQTFERFYHRESSACAFARAVFNFQTIKSCTTSLLYSLQDTLYCCRT